MNDSSFASSRTFDRDAFFALSIIKGPRSIMPKADLVPKADQPMAEASG